jgi:hypothetical protein
MTRWSPFFPAKAMTRRHWHIGWVVRVIELYLTVDTEVILRSIASMMLSDAPGPEVLAEPLPVAD